jgi:sec-independent protein translocase protein TatC
VAKKKVAKKKDTQPDNIDRVVNKYYPYFLEIRKRIFLVVAVFLVGGFIGFFFYEKFILLISDLLQVPGVNIVVTSPFQFLNLALNASLIFGFVLAFPLIIAQVLGFLRPALTDDEYKKIIALIPIGFILFIIGFAYGAVMMRYVVFLFYEKSVELDIGNILDISMLLSKILITSTLMGIAFQFPIVLTILMRLRIVRFSDIQKQRALAWTASIFFAAFLPPTDLLSLALLTLPLVFLFETTLILNKVLLKTHLL